MLMNRKNYIFNRYQTCFLLIALCFFGASNAHAAKEGYKDKIKKVEWHIDHGDIFHLKKAYDLINELKKSHPRKPDVLIQSARFHIKFGSNYGPVRSKGHMRLAKNNLLLSKQINPNYAKTYVLLGHYYTLMDQLNLAEAALRKAEKIGTNDPWLYLNWVDLLLRQGRKVRAYNRILRLFTNGVDHPVVLAVTAQKILTLGGADIPVNFNEAIDNIILKHSNDIEWMLLAADAFKDIWGGQTALLRKSSDIINLAYQKAPNDYRVFLVAAEIKLISGYKSGNHYNNNSFTKASLLKYSKLLESAKRLAEDNNDWINAAYFNMYRREKNKAGMERIMPIFWRKYGIPERSNHPYSSMLRFYYNIGLDNKNFVNSLFDKAYPAFRMGKFVAAPVSKRFYINRLIKEKDYSQAKRVHLINIKDNPTNAWALNNYAFFLIYRTGEIDEAIKFSRKALNIMDFGNARYALGTAYYIKWARSLRRNYPNQTLKYYRLARQNYDDVQDLFTRFSINPKFHYVMKQIYIKHKDRININKLDEWGDPPLYNVYWYRGKYEDVQTLVKWGANINFVKKSGWTILTLAVVRNDMKMTKMLIKHGANYRHRYKGKSLADIARGNKSYKLEKYLRSLKQ